MIGSVDEAGRSLLNLQIRAAPDGPTARILAWIDTAFDGELVMPLSMVEQLALPQSAAIRATLADGTDVILEAFECNLEWFGQWRPIQFIANEGWLPLLGVALLCDRKLTIDFPSKMLTIE